MPATPRTVLPEDRVAEIRIEPKRRSLAWLWILLVLAVVALVAWYLVSQGAVRVQDTTTTPTGALPAPALSAPAHAAPAARALA
jgi:predicted anti-sigma-YlaC factor YlaD